MSPLKLAAFDLEIVKEIPEGTDDWQSLAPLGVSCAALACSDNPQVRFWQGNPGLDPAGAQGLVQALQQAVKEGYTLVTWNGCKFDFPVLAQESGLTAACGELAMGHFDLMLEVTFRKGWLLGLQKALKGAGLEGKRKVVTLKDGRVLTDMDGSQAPRLWAQGETEAVLAYLHDDAVQTLKLAQSIQNSKAIRWTSESGKPQLIVVDRLRTVRECFALPEPDTKWMKNPVPRKKFTAWISTN
jgi:hypothetical protein